MPKVSIIIPVYNVEKYLRDCLESVVNQTLHDIEIICVNDCSPDNSLAILKEYKEKDNRIKIIDLKENGGLGNARNVAIKEVTSEYIMFLDSDDWLELDACEQAYEQIVKNNNDFVLFNLYVYYEKTKKKEINTSKLTPFLDIENKPSAKPADINIPFFNSAECWYKIYNTNFIINNNITFDTSAFEDQCFNIKIFSTAKSISVLNKPLYNYRIRKSSISTTSSNWKDCLLAKQRAYELLKNLDNIQPNLIDFFLIATINSIMYYFNKYSKLDKNIRNEFYKNIHRFFSVLDMENSIEKIKTKINYKNFKLIIKNENYFNYRLQKLINIDIFSVQNNNITIFGIKLKLIKRNSRPNN